MAQIGFMGMDVGTVRTIILAVVVIVALLGVIYVLTKNFRFELISAIALFPKKKGSFLPDLSREQVVGIFIVVLSIIALFALWTSFSSGHGILSTFMGSLT